MHIDTQSLVALGVALHLLGALAKLIWRSPKQQVQINLIETKIDLLLGQRAYPIAIKPATTGENK